MDPPLVCQQIGQSPAGEHITGADMAAAFSRTLGQQVEYVAMDPAAYRALGFPGADDLGNMFQFYRDFNSDFNKKTTRTARYRPDRDVTQ